MEEEAKKAWDGVSRTMSSSSSKCSEVQNADRNDGSKSQACEISDWNGTILGIGLETRHVTFWQRTGLYSVLIP